MKNDDLTARLRTLAHACVSGQERLEREHGEYDVKAALWALGSLRGCIDAEPLEGDAAAYRDRLLARMRAHHEHYRSDSFSEEYGGGRASMGSAVHAFERQSGELLDGAQPARRRWPWYVWGLLAIGFLLAVSNLHSEAATTAPTAEIHWSPVDLALLPYGWRKPNFGDARGDWAELFAKDINPAIAEDDFDGDGCVDTAVVALPRKAQAQGPAWRLFVVRCAYERPQVVDLGKWSADSNPHELTLGVIDPGVIPGPLLAGGKALRLRHVAITLRPRQGVAASVIYWDDKRGAFARAWLAY